MSNVSLIDGHIDNAEHCVCCGQVIPEGRQVCIICGKKVNGKQRQIDRIRNMSVEELAEFLKQATENLEVCDCCPADKFCTENANKFGCSVTMFKKWLESEVTE